MCQECDYVRKNVRLKIGEKYNEGYIVQELDKADILAFPKSLFAGVKPNAWDKRCEEILEDQYNIDPRIKLNEETGVKIGWRWEDKDESKCS